jgi:hypothetical protein
MMKTILDRVRAAIAAPKATSPTAELERLHQTQAELQAEYSALRTQRDSLRNSRSAVVLRGPSAEVEAHDAEEAAAQRRIDDIERIIRPELQRRIADAERDAAISEGPQLPPQLVAGLQRAETALAEFRAAQGQLRTIASRCEHVYDLARRSGRLHQLGIVPEEVQATVEAMLRLHVTNEGMGLPVNWRLPSPPTEDLGRVPVFDVSTGQWEFRGEWTEDEKREWWRRSGQVRRITSREPFFSIQEG